MIRVFEITISKWILINYSLRPTKLEAFLYFITRIYSRNVFSSVGLRVYNLSCFPRAPFYFLFLFFFSLNGVEISYFLIFLRDNWWFQIISNMRNFIERTIYVIKVKILFSPANLHMHANHVGTYACTPINIDFNSHKIMHACM